MSVRQSITTATGKHLTYVFCCFLLSAYDNLICKTKKNKPNNFAFCLNVTRFSLPYCNSNSSDCNSTGSCMIPLLAPSPLLKFIMGHTCMSCFKSLEKNQPNTATHLFTGSIAYVCKTSLNTIIPGPLYYDSLSRETS